MMVLASKSCMIALMVVLEVIIVFQLANRDEFTLLECRVLQLYVYISLYIVFFTELEIFIL